MYDLEVFVTQLSKRCSLYQFKRHTCPLSFSASRRKEEEDRFSNRRFPLLRFRSALRGITDKDSGLE
jgi:hypothetical protein